MIAKTPYVEDFPQPVIKAIGAAEVLGAIGLVAPALSGIVPGIVPVAATGLTLLTAVMPSPRTCAAGTASRPLCRASSSDCSRPSSRGAASVRSPSDLVRRALSESA
jgi:hypothetical protein